MSVHKDTTDPAPTEGKAGAAVMSSLWASVAVTVILIVICCVLYPLAVWAVAQVIFPHQANGSLLRKDGSKSGNDTGVVGSSLIGQVFTDAKYFHPRPSAANNSPGNNTTTTANLDGYSPTGGYDPTSSGGSNLGPLSDMLINGSTGTGPAPDAPPAPVAAPAAGHTAAPAEHLFYDGIRIRTLHYAVDNKISFKLYSVTPAGVKTEVPLKTYLDSSGNLTDIALVDAFPHPPADALLPKPRDFVLIAGDFKTADGKPVLIPADAVTASASGLDPHISPANAMLQAQRVADQRKLSLRQVTDLIDQNTDGRDIGFLGDPGVNVLRLNLALDNAYPASKPVVAFSSSGPGTGGGGGNGNGGPGSSGPGGPSATTTSSPTTTAADAGRRNLPPAPLDSPPFPNSDWTGPDILVGTGDGTSPSRIEGVIKDTSIGKLLADHQVRVYGWVDLGGNVSTSNHSNGPAGYDLEPDSVVLNQAVLRIERVPDSSQADHADWGFRVTQLYGTDYRYTTAKGFLSGQLLRNNRLYGYDIPETYAAVYLPHLADGVIIKVGRFLSPPDIESSLATGDYMYSHSLLFVADPVSFTGLNSIIKLNKEFSAELGVTAGADMVPFVQSASINGRAMLSYRTDSGSDSLYGGVNSIGDGKYRDGHDDLQQIIGVWGHKFTDRLHMQTEGYYMWQYDAYTGGTVIDGPTRPFAGSGRGTLIPGRADEWGVVNYLGYKLTDNDSLTLRTEFFDDIKGERAGYATMYNSETLGLSHTFIPGVVLRPEVQWDHSAQTRAFNNGLRKNQLTAAVDLILSF